VPPSKPVICTFPPLMIMLLKVILIDMVYVRAFKRCKEVLEKEEGAARTIDRAATLA
jgi:hypothetical protein